MKIVCDACSAKYSIADDKVRGKVFKIRCKKCSNIIVVRGNAEGDEGVAVAAAAPAEDAADSGNPEAVWHVVIDQQQIGPLTPEDLRARHAAGEIDAETYTWREGFGDWERLADVEPFSAWFTGGAAAATSLFGGGGGVSDDARTVQADPGDLFAARAAEPEPGADLFGGRAAASVSAGGGLFAGAGDGGESAAPAGPSELKGQRSENSVLFSLNNLAALAGDSPRPQVSSSSSSSASASSGGMAQHGGGEGSGLIDIRSMAQVYLGDTQRASGSMGSSSAVGSMDDLPVFSQSSFESASPMLMPTASAASNNKLIFMLAGLIGLLVVVAAVLVIVVVKGGDDKGEPDKVARSEAAADDDDKAKASDGDKAAPGEGDKAPEAAPSPAGGTPEDAPPETATADKPADRKPAERTTDRRSSDRDKRPAERTPERKPPEPTRAAASPVPDDGGCDEVTCLVEPDKACCKKGKKSGGSGRTTAAAVDSSLPEKPNREDISSGIGKVRGRVKACGEKGAGFKGTITAKIKIAPSGSVDSASASGGPSNVTSCVESAVRNAGFKKTQKGVTVSYPFVF